MTVSPTETVTDAGTKAKPEMFTLAFAAEASWPLPTTAKAKASRPARAAVAPR